jgi:hypothetical protein
MKSVPDLVSIKATLRQAATAHGFGPDLGDFDAVVRLTAEFADFLRDLARGPVGPAEIRYRCESVFSGVDSFCQLGSYYRMLSGEVPARDWEVMSFERFNDEFAAKYRLFLSETAFPLRFRLLLDLFRLQLLFTGMAYD